MGPALQAAFMVMSPIGGKLLLFQSAVPSLGACALPESALLGAPPWVRVPPPSMPSLGAPPWATLCTCPGQQELLCASLPIHWNAQTLGWACFIS